VSALLFLRLFTCPRGAHTAPNVTSIKKRGGGGGCLASIERRRHRGEARKDEEGDATPDLLLKHSDITLATYV
jgi:hypothetical protein